MTTSQVCIDLSPRDLMQLCFIAGLMIGVALTYVLWVIAMWRVK